MAFRIVGLKMNYSTKEIVFLFWKGVCTCTCGTPWLRPWNCLHIFYWKRFKDVHWFSEIWSSILIALFFISNFVSINKEHALFTCIIYERTLFRQIILATTKYNVKEQVKFCTSIKSLDQRIKLPFLQIKNSNIIL